MTSITCSDLEDPTYNAKLVEHLKSDDFFSSEKHKEATFEITEIKPTEGPASPSGFHHVKGKLTIKAITHEIEFPAMITFNGNLVYAEAKIKVDRTKWDIRYGSGSFFNDLGDKMIYDEFVMEVNLAAEKRNS
jgi:polyisoprenoid-binding protein YceI